MQNAFTLCLAAGSPQPRLPAHRADLHPDHQIVHEEVLISLFHAQGNIWPELGKPIAEVPKVYEFACLLRFPPAAADPHRNAARDARNQAPGDSRPIASQEQIESVVAIQRNVGPIEYLRELEFHFYSPEQYHALFARTS